MMYYPEYSQYYMGAFAFFAVLLENILRSTQNKNVAAGYTTAVFLTGGFMTLCNGVVMTIIAKNGFEMLPYTVVASALGWLAGLKLHDKITANHRAQIRANKKKRKRLKQKARTEKIVAAMLDSK